MARCLIGCGSNLGHRREQLDRAIELMRFMPGVTLVGVSRFRETAAVGGPAGQGTYLNGACLVETDLPPHEVLSMLAAVENTLERVRSDRWGPRTVDLDLLLYDGLVLDSAELTVPHPRMSTRRFVLEPCVEIAREAFHPLADCTLGEMLASISKPHPLVAVVGLPESGAEQVARAVADSTLGRLAIAQRSLPPSHAPSTAWCETLSSWTADLADLATDVDAPGLVADFWLETLRIAARQALDDEAFGRFDDRFQAAAAGVPAPHALLVLVAPAHVLRHDPDRLALQGRLLEAVRNPSYRSPLKPKAVVVIDAADPSRATGDAVAAVEAMV
jgi:2-amino-4-hydroxy-6-hydroxymethyldihydropteridine diphosphokinase